VAQPRAADEAWYEEPDELPPRRRARLLTPLTVVLMLVLFAACGFIGGVLVQKNQQSGSSGTSGFAAAATSRFGRTGATGAAGAAGGFAGRFASLFGGGAAGGGSAVGTVTDISGNKLYVTTAAGTMTEVITTPQSKITKSESVGAGAIHPGDSVVATGVTGPSGALTASSVSDSGAAASTSGASSLFGGGSSTTSSTSSVSLFGG
jgi:preprotein translocase subunit SecG